MSEIQKSIYKYIVRYFKEKGFAPTIREIGKGVGLKSTSSVYFHLKKIEKLGYIEMPVDYGPRAIRVSGYEFFKVN